MKILFIGAVEIGYTVLQSIYSAGWNVDLIITLDESLSEKTSGYVDFSPLAKENNTQIIKVKDINSPDTIKIVTDIIPDLIIVCGWQRLLSGELLRIPKFGVVGFHSSLLPKYRGRAPVNWAIIMGEKETGITMFYLTEEADAGDIIAQKSFQIMLDDDCNTIYQKAALAGAELIIEYMPMIFNGTAPRKHNISKSFPAYPKRTPLDGEIDFRRSALDVYNFVRALTKPYPGAYYYDKDNKKVIVWKIEIIFDKTRIRQFDIIHETADLPIRIVEWEVAAD